GLCCGRTGECIVSSLYWRRFVRLLQFFLESVAVNKLTIWVASVILAIGAAPAVYLSSAMLVCGPSAALDEEGFVPLFDGKTLNGWDRDEGLWKVEEGMIVGDSAGIERNEFLATKKSYGDFELRLEFRLLKGNGNSGVQFRSNRIPESSEVSGY